MLRKCSTAVVAAALASALATTMITMTITIASGGAAAADDGKYPANWQGQWTRVVHREVEVQAPSIRPAWGLGQDAPLTPEYRKVLADSMADQRTGGLGNYSDLALPPQRHAPHHDIRNAGIRHHAGHHLHPGSAAPTIFVASSPTDATGPRTANRPTGLFHRPMDRPRRQRPLRHARSRDQIFQGPRAFDASGRRWPSTTSRSSRSGSSSTRPAWTSFMSSPP